jgi:hypothetical protein
VFPDAEVTHKDSRDKRGRNSYVKWDARIAKEYNEESGWKIPKKYNGALSW